jgi:phage-related minor tail protein
MKNSIILFFILIFLTGCSKTWEGVKADSSDAWESTKENSEKAYESTKKAIHKATSD